MYVSDLTVADFRNYSRQTVTFGDKLNFITGKNGQGKTNLLEAIYLCSVGKSFRTAKDKEIVFYGSQRAKISVTAKKKCEIDKVDMIIDREIPKCVSVNGVPLTRLGDIIGTIRTVFFSPDEMKIVKDAPFDRRRFMNVALCQASKTYFFLLTKYNKTLMQRNQFLKSRESDDVLDVWDMQLADCGSKIIIARRNFVENLNGHTSANHLYLTGGEESLTLSYESIEGDTSEIKENFLKALRRDRKRDRESGFTHVGPHKDDIAFKLGEVDLRSYGSQGQQRTASLSIKLAEMDIAKEQGEYPVLLLDDVLNELDEQRQSRLLEKVKDFQTIITCTHIDPNAVDKLGECKILKVEGGKVLADL